MVLALQTQEKVDNLPYIYDTAIPYTNAHDAMPECSQTDNH